MLYLALFAALVLRHGSFAFWVGEQWNQLLYHFSFIAPFWLLFLFIFDFYEIPYRKKAIETMQDAVTVFLLAFVAGVIYFYFRSNLIISPKTILFLHLLIFMLLVYAWRYFLVRIFKWQHLQEGQDLKKQLSLEEIDDEWFIEYASRQSKIEKTTRAFIDFAAALFGMILFLVLFPFIAFAIKFTSPGPIFYTQKRVGLGGKIFTLYKFRTMIEDAEKEGPKWAEENDARVTRVGKFLRLTHLDELPQAINLLWGDLSLVGPRPERPEFTKLLEKKIPHYNLRHIVKPGILGWAQLNYSYGDSVEDAREKLKYELYYIKNRSLFLDMIILLKSLRIVLFAKGQ